MAESAVSFLTENVALLLEQDEKLRRAVLREVEILQKELGVVNSFLKDSEAKRIENDEVQKVVDRIRDVARYAEDVVDTYMAEIIEERGKNPLLRRLSHCFSDGKRLRDAANKMKSIRNTINLIYNNQYRYGILHEGESSGANIISEAAATSLKHEGSPKQEDDDDDDDEEDIAESSDREKASLKHKGSPQQEDDKLGSKRKNVAVESSDSEREDKGSPQPEDSPRWRRADFEVVVGFHHEMKTLISHLIDGNPRLDVVSITGMGGLGKTTLAFKIYNDSRVKNHFDCHAWVVVSKNHNMRDCLFGTLRCLISSLPEETYKLSDEELKLTLRAFLREKRYLIVMDDIWTSSTHVWDQVSEAFPNSFNGSRLLVTSRDRQVALFASQTPPYSLPPLDNKTSWELFRKKVFPTMERYPDLEDPGRKLVESCKGLPLSIVVLGGLLANKEKKCETWSKLMDFVSFNYSQNTRSVDILALSYNHLPRNLKSCFLYLGAFPMDFEISARCLMNMWLVEGFIPESGGDAKNLEGTAQDYLEELIGRSLIQVTNRRTDGGAKKCRVHDLLREISISESMRENFLEVHSEDNSASTSSKARRFSQLINRRTNNISAALTMCEGLLRKLWVDIFERTREKFFGVPSEAKSEWISKARRFSDQETNRRTDAMTCHDPIKQLISIFVFERLREQFLGVQSEANLRASVSKARRLSIQGGNISEYISSNPSHVPSRLRSLLVFGEGEEFGIKQWKLIYRNFKFLRVLCLEKVNTNSIPKHIKKLIFLRYLRIWSEKVIKLAAIPASICNLQYLETIEISGQVEQCLPKEIWTMAQLRNVRFSGGMSFPAASGDGILFYLQALSYLLVDDKTERLISRVMFPYLKKLSLKFDHGLTQMNEFEVADVLERLALLTKLENLKILDFPTSEPRPNLFPSTLVKITFLRSYFNSTHFGILAKLPNLQILKLKDNSPHYGVLGLLNCVAGDFPKLQVFQMIHLEAEIWALESGSMEKLERLVICECYQLKNVPKELCNLSALALVEVSRMPQSFTKMINELKLKDHCKLLIDSKPHKSDIVG